MSVAIAYPTGVQQANVSTVVALPTFLTGKAAYERGDYVTARTVWITLARQQRHAEACYFLGTLYDEGKGVRANARKALRYYRRAARLSYVLAHTQLGTMYWHGDGVAKNGGQALQHYRTAAAQGDELAAYFLGVLYLEGRPASLNDTGVPQDPTQALAWFQQAAAAGLVYAQRKLAWLRTRGIG